MNDYINYIPSNTPDFQTELAEKLAEFAPEAIADGKIDVEKLKELLNGDADESNERFGLFWPGKKRALRAAQQPTTATLKPDVENSKDWDTTKNVFIEGDNLEVLKVLQKHYHGKIKMIYIDPPYNTGKDFVYPDNFKEGLGTYLEWTKQVNEEGQKLSTNSESEGRYHSNWLNMIYPRLKLARNLLTDDGVIFISISDDEYGNLRKCLDEVFGESNFEGSIHWRRRHNQPNDPTKLIGIVAEHILVYARNSRALKKSGVGKLPLTGKFSNPDGDPRGPWNSKPWKVGTGQGGSRYSITTPAGNVYEEVWMGEERTFLAYLEDSRIVFPNGGAGFPRKKQFQSERAEKGQSATNWFTHEIFGSNQEGTSEVEELFEAKGLFDNPKPTKLLENLIRLGNLKDNDIVLDFFSGSSTTAHATLKLNAEDGENRRHIQVQLPEPTPENSEAHKAGYSTISELSRERIRRAGEKIRQDFSEQLSKRNTPLDVGFRAYQLSDTSFSKWQVSSDTPANELEQHLLELRESANDNATPADLFVELLLKQGYSLTEDIGDVSIAGLDFKTVLDADGDVAVLAYLDEHSKPTLDQLREIADSKPVRFVILEDCFQGDDELKTNLVQICKTNGIELWTA